MLWRDRRADPLVIAAITAGGRVPAAFARTLGTDVKALTMIDGATLLDAAIDAARGAGARRIVVVGGSAVRQRCGQRVDEVVTESPDGRTNLRAALNSASEGEALLLLASDLPFVNGPDVDAFVKAARGWDAALPVAAAAHYERRFPGAPPHAITLAGERVVNGSMVYFGPGAAPVALAVAEQLFAARKSLWRMAVLLGPRLLARFARGTLSVNDIERHAERLLQFEARAVRDASPTLCFDVDTLDDYRYALTARDTQTAAG